jgi:hypothetical protein
MWLKSLKINTPHAGRIGLRQSRRSEALSNKRRPKLLLALDTRRQEFLLIIAAKPAILAVQGLIRAFGPAVSNGLRIVNPAILSVQTIHSQRSIACRVP